MDRRASERYRVWFPMTVVTDAGGEGTSITYDVSARGLLMACAGALATGTRVLLRFRVRPDEPERRIPGSVVRVEENPGEPEPWRYRMAVAFDEPQPELEGVLSAEALDA